MNELEKLQQGVIDAQADYDDARATARADYDDAGDAAEAAWEAACYVAGDAAQAAYMEACGALDVVLYDVRNDVKAAYMEAYGVFESTYAVAPEADYEDAYDVARSTYDALGVAIANCNESDLAAWKARGVAIDVAADAVQAADAVAQNACLGACCDASIVLYDARKDVRAAYMEACDVVEITYAVAIEVAKTALSDYLKEKG